MEVAEIARRLDALDSSVSHNGTRIESHMSSCDVRNGQQEKTNVDHETRIRDLEKFRWKVAGVYSIVCLVGSAIGSVLVQKVFGG